MTKLLSPGRIEDLQIEEAVRIALERHARVPYEQIDVTVAGGVATLRGTVDWRYERDAAVAAARTTSGVGNVVSEVTVKFG